MIKYMKKIGLIPGPGIIQVVSCAREAHTHREQKKGTGRAVLHVVNRSTLLYAVSLLDPEVLSALQEAKFDWDGYVKSVRLDDFEPSESTVADIDIDQTVSRALEVYRGTDLPKEVAAPELALAILISATSHGVLEQRLADAHLDIAEATRLIELRVRQGSPGTSSSKKQAARKGDLDQEVKAASETHEVIPEGETHEVLPESQTPDPKEGLVSVDSLGDFDLSIGAKAVLDGAMQKAAEFKGADAAVTATLLIDSFQSLDDPDRNAIWFMRDQLERHATEGTGIWMDEYYEFYAGQIGPPISEPRKGKYPIGWLSPSTSDFLTYARNFSLATIPLGEGRVHARHLVAAIIVRTFDGRTPIPGSFELFGRFGIDQRSLVDDFLHWFETKASLIEGGDSLEAWLEIFGRKVGTSGVMPRIELESPRGPDLIGIDTDVESLATIVAAQNLVPPLAVGLFGDWGSGKSFFMEKLHERISFLAHHAEQRESREQESAYHSRVAQIWFNAWNYAEANLWASLVTHIFESLYGWFQPKDSAEERQWQKLLQRLDEASTLRAEAEQGLAAAQGGLEAARNAKRTHVQKLTATVTETWGALAESDALGKPFKNLEAALNQEELLEVRESLLLRREEAESLLQRLPLFRRTLAKGLGSLRALGAFGFVMAGLLFVVIWAVQTIGDDTLDAISGQIAAATALVGGVSAWLGTAFRKATGVVDAVHSAGQALVRGLADGTIDDHELRAAEEGVAVASKMVTEYEDQIVALRHELGTLQPSRRLTSFLASRAESSDYRKHLGLPAMIRRDFAQLQTLMNEMKPKSFALSKSAHEALRTEDTAVPPEFFKALNDLRLDMTAKPEVIVEGDLTIVRDLDRDFEIRVEADGSCTVRWARLRIDRIVLYIDDLDRCPSKRVVEVLQAVRLLLDFELFVVVVGVDARWVTQALVTHHQLQWRGDDSEELNDAAEPQDFLEKIFQIPLWLEPLEVDGTKRYLRGLTGGGDGSRPGGEDKREQRVEEADTETADTSDTDTSETSDTQSKTEQATDAELDQGVDEAVAESDTKSNLESQTGGTVEVRGGDGIAHGEDEDPGDSVMKPRGLELDPAEREFMLELAAVMGRSPRAVKRFVNVYRLIRARVTGSELRTFVGTEERPGSYKAAQFLLAVIVGTPAIAEQLFDQIRLGSLHDLGAYANDQIAKTLDQPAKHEDWKKIKAFLVPKPDADAETDRPPPIGDIQEHVADWVDRVGRYSFRVGRR